jgi:hypothetical protein
MSKEADMAKEIEALRKALEESEAELRKIRVHNARMGHRLQGIPNILEFCELMLNNESKVMFSRNSSSIFGRSATGCTLGELFGTTAAREYADRVAAASKDFRRLAEEAEDEPWTQVFPKEGASGSALTDWVSAPSNAWQRGRAWASVPVGATGEHYLSSPVEMAMPDEDLRIEYTARAADTPRDLSVTVGRQVTSDDLGDLLRPENTGYCFGFGALGNQCTQLQRTLMSVVATTDAVIEQGRDHRCVAERIGGVFRFSVDGRIVYSQLDLFPLVMRGNNYVSLYTCGSGHEFRDLAIFTRPSCLPEETRQWHLDHDPMALEIIDGRARFVEAHYVGDRRFMLKDITDVIEERQRLEEQRRHMEKVQALVEVAGAAAHEINQPLTVIMGYVCLLMTQGADEIPADIRQGLEAVKESADRLSEIVKKLGDIRTHRIKQYVGNTNILDIDASSGSG